MSENYEPLSRKIRRLPRKAKVLILVAIALLVVGFFLQPRSGKQKAVAASYTNPRYGYTLTIPSGWRLGTVLTNRLNTAAGEPVDISDNSQPYNAAEVVFTTLNPDDEQSQARLLQPLTYYGRVLTGNTILISAESEDFGLRFAQLVAAANATSLNKNLPTIMNVQQLELASSTGAVAYELTEPGQANPPIETVFIPYRGSNTFLGPNGDLVKGVSIRSVRDDQFDESAFETAYKSFRYVQ